MGIILEKKEKYTLFKNYVLNFQVHLHDAIEIAFIHKGTIDFYSENEKFTLAPGDVAISFPNQIHSYENGKDVDSSLFIFPPTTVPAFVDIFRSKVPEEPVFRDEDCRILHLLDAFFNIYDRDPDTRTDEVALGFLQSVLGILFSKVRFKERKEINLKTPVRLLYYCDEHYKEPITIKDAANHLQISESYLRNIFSTQLHTTFTEYIQRKRIHHARKLLRNGTCNVTEAAFASGFNCVRSFSRVFTKYSGISPQNFVKSLKEKH